jgi:hypothetical protein
MLCTVAAPLSIAGFHTGNLVPPLNAKSPCSSSSANPFASDFQPGYNFQLECLVFFLDSERVLVSEINWSTF